MKLAANNLPVQGVSWYPHVASAGNGAGAPKTKLIPRQIIAYISDYMMTCLGVVAA